ncbi:Cation/multidrug efflux pump, Membrane fusion protein (MFP) family [Rubellimicrobium mesophilum DSM 19309]|uniref:Cation/multidrug efflux pump, Membrane fusion protein (MFP) family n=1 Tax=Rubellimicrobium mesophilum DSM 19309 TaxID=442562 RepID=A0A017HSL7_9RHOB|nr:efflux RND transporter periplasmic adaptor subunit [Rubellimicrobium mesophilum]EYD77376.1 Cation/multidrug efflux pump, Membrane fusion protein (MFP) family [Rubellimicrobium mesophilum DSM 19309]
MPALIRALTIAALLAAPGLARSQEASASEAPPATETALPAITVSEVRPQTLTDRVVASGLVDAVEEVQVQPLVEGQPIDALLADVGDSVEEGQVLARLSTSTLELQLSQLAANRASTEAQIAQAEANVIQATANAEEAERQAARNAELVQAGSVPQAQADQTAAAAKAARAGANVAEQGVASARAQLELVDAQIANARLQLSRTEVKAPVAGLVVARNAQVGAIASAAGAAMFTVVRDNAMEMRADVSEQDLLRLRPGQVARLTSVEGAEPIAGTVRLVEPAIDPTTRLGTARIQIDDPSRVVKGMFLTAEVIVAEEDQLAVPVTAVGANAEGATVMRVRDGMVERVPVTLGIRDGGLVGIAEGLSEGDLVVTKAGAFVRPGDRINPVPADAQASAQAPTE